MRDDLEDLLAVELAELIPRIRNVLIRPVEAMPLPGIPLTPTQIFALLVVEANDDYTMSRLAAEISVSKQQLTKIVAALIDNGYVIRELDKTHYRIIYIRVTEKGRALIQVLKDQIKQVHIANFSIFTDEEAERFMDASRTMRGMLERIKPHHG